MQPAVDYLNTEVTGSQVVMASRNPRRYNGEPKVLKLHLGRTSTVMMNWFAAGECGWRWILEFRAQRLGQGQSASIAWLLHCPEQRWRTMSSLGAEREVDHVTIHQHPYAWCLTYKWQKSCSPGVRELTFWVCPSSSWNELTSAGHGGWSWPYKYSLNLEMAYTTARHYFSVIE